MKFRFSGHETFVLRFAWLPKAVRGVSKNPALFADEDQAMVDLGVGKNMVRSIKFWAQQTGILEGNGKEFQVTDFGTRVLGEKGLDPFLENQQTLWLLHWNLCNQSEPLYAWHRLMNEWQEPELTQSSALKDAMRLMGESKRLSESSLKSHLSVFTRTYTPTRARKNRVFEDNLDSPLVLLRLLEYCGERYADGKSESVYQFRREAKPEIGDGLFVYALMDFWRRHAPDEETLSFHETVYEVGSPGQLFKMPEEELRQRFEEVQEASDGMIEYVPSALMRSVKRTTEFGESEMSAALEGVYA